MRDNKILFLTIAGRNGASSRYRVYQFLPSLEAAGLEVRVIPPAQKPRGFGRLVAGLREESELLKASSGSDVIFIQKRLFGARFIGKLAGLGKRIVFDFDDSIFTSPSGGWSWLTRKKVTGRLKAVLGASGLVITGNGFLSSFAESNGARRTEVLQTAVDVSRYTVKEHRPGPPTLGWIGHSVNHRYIDTLSGVLPSLGREFPGLRLLVVSDKDYFMDGITVENRRWSEAREAADILDMDIGLMPLVDDEWTRGKCALKALQYMASGIPPVCSAVGANNEVVEHGVDGFLARGSLDWMDSLHELIRYPARRAEVGLAARRKVDERYSLHVYADRLAGLLRQA
ncbi:MAG: glycosyltransferase family 4 protein [Nitrospirae bacterium]|nr:glycosyltransferase family 4 protein [Nitrospirota bacterium]